MKENSKLSGKKHHNTSPFHAIASATYTVVFHDDLVHDAQKCLRMLKMHQVMVLVWSTARTFPLLGGCDATAFK
jgi:hypothetical protein